MPQGFGKKTHPHPPAVHNVAGRLWSDQQIAVQLKELSAQSERNTRPAYEQFSIEDLNQKHGATIAFMACAGYRRVGRGASTLFFLPNGECAIRYVSHPGQIAAVFQDQPPKLIQYLETYDPEKEVCLILFDFFKGDYSFYLTGMLTPPESDLVEQFNQEILSSPNLLGQLLKWSADVQLLDYCIARNLK